MKIRRLPYGILLWLVFPMGSSFHAGATTIHVDGPGPHILRDAIRDARAGDTLFVGRGIYSEGNLVISKRLFLNGQGKAIIDGQNAGEIFTITSDSVTIEGFTIQHTGYSYIQDRAGIKVNRAVFCRIINNKLLITCFGIYLKSSKHCRVEGNLVQGKPLNEINSGNGIHLYDCTDIVVRNNRVSGHRDGIYFEFVSGSRIEGNVSYNNLRYGLHFMFSNHDEYLGNTFSSNGTGVAVMYSKFISMRGNRFLDNWGPASYGLLFKEIYDGDLTANVFKGNTVGLFADGAVRIQIRYNDFSDNGWALNIPGNSTGNLIANNNFTGNSFDVTTGSQQNGNRYEHNFWDHYTGYDLDHDGVGDIPYRPVRLFSYVLSKVPASIILLRSFLEEALDFAEKVSPVLTPVNLVDDRPCIKRNTYAGNQGA